MYKGKHVKKKNNNNLHATWKFVNISLFYYSFDENSIQFIKFMEIIIKLKNFIFTKFYYYLFKDLQLKILYFLVISVKNCNTFLSFWLLSFPSEFSINFHFFFFITSSSYKRAVYSKPKKKKKSHPIYKYIFSHLVKATTW